MTYDTTKAILREVEQIATAAFYASVADVGFFSAVELAIRAAAEHAQTAVEPQAGVTAQADAKAAPAANVAPPWHYQHRGSA